MAAGTICHHPDEEGNFTDEQLVKHLIHTTCSECSAAGFRMKELLEELNKLKNPEKEQ